MEEKDFRLLVVADLHHVPGSTGPDPAIQPPRRVDLAAEMLRRAIDDALHRGAVDAVALMGDLLDDGTRPDAQLGAEQLREVVAKALPDTPLLVVPGNHDANPDKLLAAMGCHAGLHNVGPYRFVVFADRFAPGDFCTRGDSDRRLLAETAAQEGGPIIVLQHTPMNPEIDSREYPYMLLNRPQVMEEYRQAKVLLSLSGHAHWGQELNHEGGVAYFTSPGLCEAPYRYAIVTLRGRQVSVQECALQFTSPPPVMDVHVHTEYAFCGQKIDARTMIGRAREFGLSGVVLTEHAPQLYVQAEDFWQGRHVRQIGLWRDRAHWRVEGFRELLDTLRDRRYVFAGLEVEVDLEGKPILREEDGEWADVLVGALHFLSDDAKTLSDEQIKVEFLRYTEALLAADVDVLAHPLRIFGWAKRPTPPEVIEPLVRMLRDSGVAAEINFHYNTQHEEFLWRCIEEGVKIAFGSDSHTVPQVGNLGANLALVQRLAGRQDVSDLLYDPKS